MHFLQTSLTIENMQPGMSNNNLCLIWTTKQDQFKKSNPWNFWSHNWGLCSPLESPIMVCPLPELWKKLCAMSCQKKTQVVKVVKLKTKQVKTSFKIATSLTLSIVKKYEHNCKIQWKNKITSNDIIAGNGRILSVHEYCVVIFV